VFLSSNALLALALLGEAQAENQNPPAFLSMAWILPVLLLLYFMVLGPQRREDKRRKELLAKLKKGDRIVNSGGIIGIVDSVKDKDEEVVLKGGLRITCVSIVRIEEETKDSSA
jgi:preprotein translocase subunit YajC